MISRWCFFSKKANWDAELLTNWNGGDLCEDVEKWVAIGVDNVVSKRLFVVREEVDRVHGLRGQPIQEAASGRFKSILIWTTCNLSFSFISCMDLGPGTCTHNHQQPGLWGPSTTCVIMLGAAGSPGKIGSELVLFTPGRADKARLQTLTIGSGWGWGWWICMTMS